MMQSWTGVGRMGRDPQQRTTDKGNMCTFSLAISRGFADKEEVTWVNCSVIGQLADNVARFGVKGRTVAVEGYWVSYPAMKDGVKYTGWSVRVNFLRFIDSPTERRGTNRG